MGLFDRLFGWRDRDFREAMNPLPGMKLRDFVIVDDDPAYLKHYFRFRNKEGEDEEFIVAYGRVGPNLKYLSTLSRRSGWGPEFRALNETDPWSQSITYLIEEGRRRSAKAHLTRGHFASRIGPVTLSQQKKTGPRYAAQQQHAEIPTPVQFDAINASFLDEVRKHPKDFAIWMHEPSPGEFAVLLVLLDDDGNMADGWSLGTFPSRKEQGGFALEAARELQISLNDVVRISPQE